METNIKQVTLQAVKALSISPYMKGIDSVDQNAEQVSQDSFTFTMSKDNVSSEGETLGRMTYKVTIEACYVPQEQ